MPSAIASAYPLIDVNGRAEVVRDAQEERPLVTLCRLELDGHRIDAPGEAGELVVGDARRGDAGGEVAVRDAARRVLHGGERTGEAAGEERGHDRGDDQRERRP